MKRELILSAAILSFLAVAPAYAQEQEKEKPQETKPAQTPNEEHKPVDSKKAPKQQTQAPKEQQQSKEQQKQDEKSAKRQQQTQKQQEQAAKQQKEQQGVARQQQQEEKQQKKEQKQVAKQQEQESRNQRAGSEQRDNGGQRGQRIPDDRFRAHFGHEHHFRVSVHERNHFSYGGYVFEFVDPWPVYWSYDDDCYIEEIGGAYYLFDVLHPGVRILVVVVQ